MIAESTVIRKAKNYGALFDLLLSNMFESTRYIPFTVDATKPYMYDNARPLDSKGVLRFIGNLIRTRLTSWRFYELI